MGFPNDLNNVAVFKIHPAIGIARLANNEDYYEFFSQQALPPDQRKYMSDVDGKPTMRRQAVQFKIFAYGQDLSELGEMTEEIMKALNITAKWTADVANRKLLNFGKRKGTPLPAIAAAGSATGSEKAELKGNNPWDASKKITLGFITGQGLFIPGYGGVARKDPQSTIAPYPADQDTNLDCADSTADGSISVTLDGTGIPVIPACVVCAPQEHSPDVNAGDPALLAGNVLPEQIFGNNADWTTGMKELLGITGDPPSNTGTKMDAAIIATTNGEYNPGMEMSFDFTRTEFKRPDLPKLFFKRGTNFIWTDEIRPKYKTAATEPDGALPGQLTSGLCSTWQGDLSACLEYWTAEFPQGVLSNDQARFLFREACDSDEQISEPEKINELADQMGVARNVSTDPDQIIYQETERKC